MIAPQSHGIGVDAEVNNIDPTRAIKTDGFVSKRRTTDTCWCALLILFLTGWGIVAWQALEHGDPDLLTHGTDSTGAACGGAIHVDKPYVAYPRLAQDVTFQSYILVDDPTAFSPFGVCVASCPAAGDVVCTATGESAMEEHVDSTLATGSAEWKQARLDTARQCSGSTDLAARLANETCDIVGEQCWETELDSAAYQRRCLPVARADRVDVTVCTSPASVAGQRLSVVENGVTIFSAAADAEVRLRCSVSLTHTVNNDTGPAYEDPFTSIRAFGGAELLQAWSADVWEAIMVVLVCGGGAAMVLCVAWLAAAACGPLRTLNMTAFLAIVALGANAVACYDRAGLVGSSSIDLDADVDAASTSVSEVAFAGTSSFPARVTAEGIDRTRYKFAAYAFTLLAIVATAMAVFLRRRLRVAAVLTSEVLKAVARMPATAVVPVVVTVLTSGLVLLWAFVGISASANVAVVAPDVLRGTLQRGTVNLRRYSDMLMCRVNTTSRDTLACSIPEVITWEESMFAVPFVAYNLLALLWAYRFFEMIGLSTVLGAVARWYWTLDRRRLEPGALSKSAWRTLRYHAGSAAFGGLLLALFHYFRLLVLVVDRQLLKTQDRVRKNKWLRPCVGALAGCFEGCARRVTPAAFVYVSMKGHHFCKGGQEAVNRTLEHLPTVSSPALTMSFVVLLGKLSTSALCALGALLWLENDSTYGGDTLTSVHGPILAVVLLSYATASVFFDALEMSLLSILMSHCEDVERNTGSILKPFYASAGLRKAIEVSSFKFDKEMLRNVAKEDDAVERDDSDVRGERGGATGVGAAVQKSRSFRSLSPERRLRGSAAEGEALTPFKRAVDDDLSMRDARSIVPGKASEFQAAPSEAAASSRWRSGAKNVLHARALI